ncbi:MAG: methylmalonyl-CoA mutase, partial [Actinobacteria bacterium]|nr:methylmalonyl-CoA mutase [Actinomycetota bacterium]
ADPLGGSWYVEALTDEIERQAEALFAHIVDLGDGSMLDGCVTGIEEGWFQGEIAEAAYQLERKLNDGRHIVVGVNACLEGNDEPQPEILYIDEAIEMQQIKRLAAVRHGRDGAHVAAALQRLRVEAADPEINLMPALLEASGAQATLGEMMSAMADVFGRWEETAKF